MFGLGFTEIVVVLVVALLVLGPEKLPKLARQLGRGMREFRRAASEFQSTLSAADPSKTPVRPSTPVKPPPGTIEGSVALESNESEITETPDQDTTRPKDSPATPSKPTS